MGCFPRKEIGGRKTTAARSRGRTTVRLQVECLEERRLLTGPPGPFPYTPDTVFKHGTYWIHVPASYDATHQTPAELFVWSHGCGGQSEFDIFDVVSTAGGPSYIAITVDGREGGCWDVNADTPLIRNAIADVKTHFNIDPQRVVLGGYSSGGDLSYRIAFTHSTEIAGVLAENTSPFRDTGLTAEQALAAPFHFNIVHLAHTEDDTYPIAGVRAETAAVRAAGLPGDGWATLQLIERPGTHFDADMGNTGTVYDMKTFLLPHLGDGWRSPGGAQPSAPAVFVTGADAGGGPDVRVFNAVTRALVSSFFPYNAAFTGGVRVAVGDVNGDGVADVITAAGPGGGPDVAVFNGKDVTQRLFRFYAFAENFTGGVFVGAGDVNTDGFADVICGADSGGGPNITVYSGKDNGQTLLSSFFAYDSGFTGGVRVASADVNGDGFADVICGAGRGGGPNITVFSGKDNAQTMLFSFFAYDPGFSNGIFVAGGDVNGDGRADIMAGAGRGGGPNVVVFNGLDAARLNSFNAYEDNFIGGVRVATAVQPNGIAFLVAVEAGQTDPQAGPLSSPLVRVFNALTSVRIDEFFAVNPNFTGGLYVAGTAK